MERRYDSIIAGAGIAGLGVAAILAKEGGHRVLVLDRYPKFGGRMMSYHGAPTEGWHVDVGLHMVELGEKSSSNELNKRVGKKVKWGPFSETVDFWDGEKFVSLAELVPFTAEDKAAFKNLLGEIAVLSDAEIEAWDNRSLEEWLFEKVSRDSIRELFTDLGMIMTTIPKAIDMAAGEVLYITRDNLLKTRQALQSSYPINGMEGLTRGLVEVIEEYGGEVRLCCEVQEVVIRDKRAVGVRVVAGSHLYEEEYRIVENELLSADRVVCALPIYQLDRIIDFAPESGPLPGWWTKRIADIRGEITGLIGFMIGLKEPVVPIEKLCFFTALKTRHTGFPFQAFPASNFAPNITPAGKQILHTNIVCEHTDASDKFKRKRLAALLWEDIKEMFPEIEKKVEWKIPYYVDGCDGLARKPGLVGNFKPALRAPGSRIFSSPGIPTSDAVWR